MVGKKYTRTERSLMKIVIDRKTPLNSFLKKMGFHDLKVVKSTARVNLINTLDTDSILLPDYHCGEEDSISVADVWMRMGANRHQPLDIYCLRAMWKCRAKLEERFRKARTTRMMPLFLCSMGPSFILEIRM